MAKAKQCRYGSSRYPMWRRLLLLRCKFCDLALPSLSQRPEQPNTNVSEDISHRAQVPRTFSASLRALPIVDKSSGLNVFMMAESSNVSSTRSDTEGKFSPFPTSRHLFPSGEFSGMARARSRIVRKSQSKRQASMLGTTISALRSYDGKD